MDTLIYFYDERISSEIHVKCTFAGDVPITVQFFLFNKYSSYETRWRPGPRRGFELDWFFGANEENRVRDLGDFKGSHNRISLILQNWTFKLSIWTSFTIWIISLYTLVYYSLIFYFDSSRNQWKNKNRWYSPATKFFWRLVHYLFNNASMIRIWKIGIFLKFDSSEWDFFYCGSEF